MACYVIGDVQGCFDELQALLAEIGYAPGRDSLYLLGDLVNRGPKSLEMLRWAVRESSHVATVLGNHDLHLLARHCGAARGHASDTLDDLLCAPDVGRLLGWLRQQPLLIALDNALIVHAGILPDWDEAQAVELADDVSAMIGGQRHEAFFAQMYGNKPKTWSNDLESFDRVRFAVNVFTRMRFVDDEGALDFKFKGELEKAPPTLHPWFDHPDRKLANRRIVCGHWSALGLLMRDDLWSIDTGCVWGGRLTAVRLGDGQLFQQPALNTYQRVELF